MQGGGPNDTLFGPQVHFLLFVYPLTVCFLQLGSTLTTHTTMSNCSWGGYLPHPLTTMTMTWCHHCHQLLYSKRQHHRELLLVGWVPTPAPDDDDDDDLVLSLSSAPLSKMTTLPQATARGVGTYLSP